MDKKLNEVTKVTDMAYVPVIMADGSIGQIAKSDLASVVAGVMETDNESRRIFQGMVVEGDYTGDVNDLPYGVLVYANSSAANLPVATVGYVFTTGAANGYRMQIYQTGTTEKAIYQRIYIYNEWKPWQRIDNFGYNSLAELSAGVAGQRVYNHTSGNIEDINLKGISLFHFDKDHNPSATDYPFNFGDMIHAQLEGHDGNIYKIMVAVDVTGQIKIGRKWGRTGAMIWKTVSAS